ncbi:hypothetical protein XFLM_05850 [Xylella fastidiosa subsp. fastidiosa GB514]|nr:hypothetical protein XFLM_05850 [Xylella fastidiosa subsp. fastidiosa GB514]
MGFDGDGLQAVTIDFFLASASSLALLYGPIRTRYSCLPPMLVDSMRALKPSMASRALVDSASLEVPNEPACKM